MLDSIRTHQTTIPSPKSIHWSILLHRSPEHYNTHLRNKLWKTRILETTNLPQSIHVRQN